MLEVLAALVIFSVAAVAYLQGLGDSTSVQSDLLSRNRAAMLAENVIEETRLSGELKLGEMDGEFEDTDTGFSWHTSISESETDNLMEVSVKVSWDNGAKDYRLITLMLRRSEE